MEQWLINLSTNIKQLGLVVSDAQLEQFWHYCTLLKKWNQLYNLTSVTDLEQMAYVHILDCLAIVPYLMGTTIVDLGSGAGLPSIVLAIFNPEFKITSVDSNQKKIIFQNHVINKLGLNNIVAKHERIESFLSEQKENGIQYDVIIARALASIKTVFQWVEPYMMNDTTLVLLKGVYPQAELDEILPSINDFDWAVDELHVPGLMQQRHLVTIKRKEACQKS